jgi:dTDP-glucose pyrophosphorylase
MTIRELNEFVVGVAATLGDAMRTMDKFGHEVAVLVDEQGKLAGIITDGDVRRAFLAGAGLQTAAKQVASPVPTVVLEGMGRAHVLDVMRAKHLNQIPIVDAEGTVVGLHTLSAVVGIEPRPNAAVIMAGGRGVRLGALTRDTPKPLVPVAGRPILEWIVLNLVGSGVSDLFITVNYLAHQIEEKLGDGSQLGAQIHYVRENPETPLGTAGSLALIPRDQLPLGPLLVMNADLMVQFDAGELIDEHEQNGAAVTIATRRYRHEVPFGVVTRNTNGDVESLAEKPELDVEVNAGIYVVSQEVLSLVPAGRASTMPGLIEACIAAGHEVGAWAMESDWIDVGSPRDLAKAKGQF